MADTMNQIAEHHYAEQPSAVAAILEERARRRR
jgi:hypothetical protein